MVTTDNDDMLQIIQPSSMVFSKKSDSAHCVAGLNHMSDHWKVIAAPDGPMKFKWMNACIRVDE